MIVSSQNIHSLFVRATIVSLLLMLVACSSTQGPVVIRESSQPVSGGQQEKETKDDIYVQPVSPDQKKTAIPLVERLISQSGVELAGKNYEKAISLAERGLRVDRKEPRLYLILSKAYRGEFNDKQSVYFAKQGLRYAEKSGAVYQELKKLSR